MNYKGGKIKRNESTSLNLKSLITLFYKQCLKKMYFENKYVVLMGNFMEDI